MGFDIEVPGEEQRPLRTDLQSGIELIEELSGDLTVNTKLNTNTGDNVDSVPVGGAISKPAAYWKNLSLAKVLDEILFPDIMPTYTIPEIVLTTSSLPLKEVGESVSQVFQIRGYKNDAGAFSDLKLERNDSVIWDGAFSTVPISDIPDQFDYANPNNPNYMYSYDYSESHVLTKGLTTWRAFGTYGNGLPKQNNKNITDIRAMAVRSVNAPQLSSTFGSNIISVTADYPIFWGLSASPLSAAAIEAIIEAGTANKVLVSAADSIAITYAASGQYLWFAHWAGYTTKTKWYVNAFNTGNIGGSTNLFGDATTRIVTSPTGLWTDVDFKIHVSNYPTTTYGVMELRNA